MMYSNNRKPLAGEFLSGGICRSRIEIRESEKILAGTNVQKHLPVTRLENVQRQRHAGKQDHREGKEWQFVLATHFVACFAHLERGIIAEQ